MSNARWYEEVYANWRMYVNILRPNRNVFIVWPSVFPSVARRSSHDSSWVQRPFRLGADVCVGRRRSRRRLRGRELYRLELCHSSLDDFGV